MVCRGAERGGYGVGKLFLHHVALQGGEHRGRVGGSELSEIMSVPLISCKGPGHNRHPISCDLFQFVLGRIVANSKFTD